MSKSIWKLLFPFAALLAGLVCSPPYSVAKPDYTKKEKKGCTYCHNAPNKKDLNEVGKCYAEHAHSLEHCNPKKIVGSQD